MIKTYDAREAANILKCSISHIRRNLVDLGGVKVGRKIVFSEDALKRVLQCSTNEKIRVTGGSSSSLKGGSTKNLPELRIEALLKKLRLEKRR